MATEPLGRALTPLDQLQLEHAVAELAARDAHLGDMAGRNGVPPLWPREPGFGTLVKIILEQQVSLESAAAAFGNLEAAIREIRPERFLRLDDVALRDIGFSRQKAGYCRDLARGVIDGSIDLGGLESRSDPEAHRRLTAVRGIGPWTADVYLLFVLRRPDVWPHGDRALVVSMAESMAMAEVPGYDEAASIAMSWSPWRAVAARMLWHAYLIKRGRSM